MGKRAASRPAASGSRAAASERISIMCPRRMAFCSAISEVDSSRGALLVGLAPSGRSWRKWVAGPRAPYERFHSRSTLQNRWAPGSGDHGPLQSQLPYGNVRSTECVAVRTLQLTAEDKVGAHQVSNK